MPITLRLLLLALVLLCGSAYTCNDGPRRAALVGDTTNAWQTGIQSNFVWTFDDFTVDGETLYEQFTSGHLDAALAPGAPYDVIHMQFGHASLPPFGAQATPAQFQTQMVVVSQHLLQYADRVVVTVPPERAPICPVPPDVNPDPAIGPCWEVAVDSLDIADYRPSLLLIPTLSPEIRFGKDLHNLINRNACYDDSADRNHFDATCNDEVEQHMRDLFTVLYAEGLE